MKVAQAAGTRVQGLPLRVLRSGDLVKIGTVAQDFNISPDLLRLYEREGLLVPLKSAGGTRYFTRQDYPWIDTVLRLVRQAGMSIAEIRHTLGMLPCWEQRKCLSKAKSECPVITDPSRPCWNNRRALCQNRTPQECYFCTVYRSAAFTGGLQALLASLPGTEETPSKVASSGGLHAVPQQTQTSAPIPLSSIHPRSA